MGTSTFPLLQDCTLAECQQGGLSEEADDGLPLFYTSEIGADWQTEFDQHPRIRVCDKQEEPVQRGQLGKCFESGPWFSGWSADEDAYPSTCHRYSCKTSRAIPINATIMVNRVSRAISCGFPALR
jgi:hypothetical protein